MDNGAALVGILLAFVVALFVANDANRRGMAGVAWFFGVWLFLIVFLPLYFVVRKPLPELTSQTK